MAMTARNLKVRSLQVGLVIAVAATGACGGGSTDKTAATTAAPAPATTSPPATSSSTAGTRVPVPTTLLPPTADAAIDKSLIPEGTASYEFEQSTINGEAFSSALRINASSSSATQKVEINAGRSRKKLLGTLGIPDDQKSSSVVQVDISLDNGPSVFSAVVSFGESKPIDLDVTNALRVRITVLSKSSDYSTIVAIGNPRFT